MTTVEAAKQRLINLSYVTRPVKSFGFLASACNALETI